MKHSLYNNHAKRGALNGSRNTPDRFLYSGATAAGGRKKKEKNEDRPGLEISGDKYLMIRIGQIVERFKRDPGKIAEINKRIQGFTLNRRIARAKGDTEAEKQLTDDLNNYLNSL